MVEQFNDANIFIVLFPSSENMSNLPVAITNKLYTSRIAKGDRGGLIIYVVKVEGSADRTVLREKQSELLFFLHSSQTGELPLDLKLRSYYLPRQQDSYIIGAVHSPIPASMRCFESWFRKYSFKGVKTSNPYLSEIHHDLKSQYASSLPLELARENHPEKYGKYLRTLDDILAHQDDPPEESKKEEHHQLLKTS